MTRRPAAPARGAVRLALAAALACIALSAAPERTVPGSIGVGAAHAASKRDSAEARRLYKRGLAYYQEARYVEALRAFQHSTFAGVELADAHFGQGLCFLKLGSPSDARAQFEHAVAKDPAHALARYNLGLSLLGVPDTVRAEAQLGEAARLSPGLPGVHLALARLAHRRGDLAAAERGARLEIAASPDSARPYGMLGLVLFEAGYPDTALALLQRAVELDTGLVEGHLQQGRVLDALGRYEEAADAYAVGLALDSTRVDAWSARGTALVHARRAGEAVPAFERAAALDSTDAKIVFNLGVALDQTGREEEAVGAYHESIRRDSSYADPYLNLGALLARLGRLDEARPMLERYLVLAPDSPRAEEIRRALETFPQSTPR